MRIARTFALLAILISSGLFWRLPDCGAQNRIARAEYDYYSLALTSISSSAAEASKLPEIPQRVNLLIQAVELLPAAQHDEAVRLLDIALHDVQAWGSADKAGWRQRHTAATLRNEILAVYARVDPEKTEALQKEFEADAKSTKATSSQTSLKSKSWSTQFNDQMAVADQPAKIALSLVDTDPDNTVRLVVQSLQGGTVSSVLFDIVQNLIQSGNRAVLNKVEFGIGQALAANVTLDPFSLANASVLVLSDKEMPPAARGAFVSFLMRSVQAQSKLIRDASGNGIDASYISAVFNLVSLNTRPVISQYLPEQLVMFELLLDQVAPLVSASTRSRLQAFQPELFSDPRDRLDDILKDPNPDKRDLRLVRVVAELLRSESGELQTNLDLASEAIAGFTDPDGKSAYTDLLTITRIQLFVKQQKFIEAQQLAGSISSEETRAWALLALSEVAAKSDRVLGFELISNALKALDKASPSPHKVELALTATAMLAKNDPQRAFDTFSTASKYANSSAAKVDPPTKPAFAFGLKATIGDAQTKLGVFPESLAELKINPSLAVLGTTDWFRADHIVNDFHEPSLRLQLKLQLAGAVLAQESKPRRKEPTPKKSARN
jgi:hypothetical protein